MPNTGFSNVGLELYQAANFASPMQEGLSLYLYRVATNVSRRNLPPGRGADGKRYRPALPIDLFYMLTPWGQTAEQQPVLLGWAMRVLEDSPIIPSGYLNKFSSDETFHPSETVELVLDALSLQDINNIWNGFKPNMYPSVAYVARLIVLESRIPIAEGGPVQTREFDMTKVAKR